MTFRDEQAMCPCCDDRALGPQAGHETRLRCDGCKGMLVPAREVEDMVAHLIQEPWSLDAEAKPDGEGARTCPKCTVKMTPQRLFGISIDRCAEHGVWFDSQELAMVLEAASGIDPLLVDTGPQYSELGLLGKLKSLFGSRHKFPQAPRRPKDE